MALKDIKCLLHLTIQNHILEENKFNKNTFLIYLKINLYHYTFFM